MYVVNWELQVRCVVVANVITSPPFSRQQVRTCRHLLQRLSVTVQTGNCVFYIVF